jgi:hypothetical protein
VIILVSERGIQGAADKLGKLYTFRKNSLVQLKNIRFEKCKKILKDMFVDYSFFQINRRQPPL